MGRHQGMVWDGFEEERRVKLFRTGREEAMKMRRTKCSI